MNYITHGICISALYIVNLSSKTDMINKKAEGKHKGVPSTIYILF